MLLEIFLNAFITLLVITDPLGTAAVFTSLVVGQDGAKIKAMAVKATLIAFFLLVFFSFLGAPLLTQLGISIPAFRIAGGLLLFVTAFRMLFGDHDPQSLKGEDGSYGDRSDIAVFPIAIPLLSGPGCLTAVILLASKAQDQTGGQAALIAAMVAVSVVTLACLMGAGAVQRFVGKSGLNILARVMGVVLAAMSVQFIADGIRGMNFH